MKKIQFLAVFCFVAYVQPISAAYVTSTITNGNVVDYFRSGIDYENSIGTTRLQVDFNNLNSVQINLDNEYIDQDDISMVIFNNTGTGWSGFNFELIGVGFFGPLNLTPQTGTFTDWSPYGSDLFTGLDTGAYVGFNPFEFERFSASGNIDTTYIGQYSLILTPTAVPVPAAVWLFASGLIGLISLGRYRA